MKKTIIILMAFIFFMHAANSQKVRIGFTAGSTLANYKIKDDSGDQSGNSKAGFTAGLIVNIPAGKDFMIKQVLIGYRKEPRMNRITEVEERIKPRLPLTASRSR
jgi:hypothetical protein